MVAASVLSVMLAAVAGYVVNVTFVAVYNYLQIGVRPTQTLREIHSGLFGEFVLSYMGLALFSVLVATTFNKIGILSVCRVPRSAGVRETDVHPDALAAGGDERARSEASRERASGAARLADRPAQPRAVPDSDWPRRSTPRVSRGGRIAVMLMDLDHFKEVNDTLGPPLRRSAAAGDRTRLSTVLRDDDMMARLGGDEFGVLLPDLPDDEVAFSIAERLLEELGAAGLGRGTRARRRRQPRHRDVPDAGPRTRNRCCAAPTWRCTSAKENGGGYEVYAPEMDKHNPAPTHPRRARCGPRSRAKSS